MNWSKRLIIGTLVVVCIAVSATSSVLAVENLTLYSGNNRYDGYGCKATIWTPSAFQLIQKGVAFNWVSNSDTSYGDHRWVQTGLAQGDGTSRMQNNVLLPVLPKSYKEINKPLSGYYYFELYSSQPANYARTYEVVNCNPHWWRIIIAGTSRGDYPNFADKSPVSALGEIQVLDTYVQQYGFPPDWAHFDSVQYKGQYSYMPFDQDHRVQQFGLVWFSPSHYTVNNRY